MPYSGAIPEMRLPFCMDSVVEGRGTLIRKRGMPASGLLRLVAPKRENPVNARNPESRPAGNAADLFRQFRGRFRTSFKV